MGYVMAGRRTMGIDGQERAYPPGSKNVANWAAKTPVLFAFFFAAREDQPVLLRSRGNLPAQPDFFGNSPRPP
jgi:hypothetical protein